MNVKTTLRLPETLMMKLREVGLREGRSVNEVAVRLISRGLNQPLPDEDWLFLGPLVEAPPVSPYNDEKIRSLQDGLGQRVRGLMEDLDWVRGS